MQAWLGKLDHSVQFVGNVRLACGVLLRETACRRGFEEVGLRAVMPCLLWGGFMKSILKGKQRDKEAVPQGLNDTVEDGERDDFLGELGFKLCTR